MIEPNCKYRLTEIYLPGKLTGLVEVMKSVNAVGCFVVKICFFKELNCLKILTPVVKLSTENRSNLFSLAHYFFHLF